MVLYAIGAYGRKAKKGDWDADKDFKILGGPYFSRRDEARLKKEGYTVIEFKALNWDTLFKVDL